MEAGKYVVLFTTTLGMIISSICVYYTFFKLKLNKYIKALLNVMTIQTLVSFTITSISNLIIINTGMNNKTFCLLYLIPLKFMFTTNVYLNSLISTLRFLMTWKASNSRIFNEKFIWGLSTVIVMYRLIGNYNFLLRTIHVVRTMYPQNCSYGTISGKGRLF